MSIFRVTALLALACCADAATVAQHRFESILRRHDHQLGATSESALSVEGVANITVYIRTRDNVALRTVLYYPTSLTTSNGTFGTVLERTPYDADSLADSCVQYAALGFVCAAQDFRGKFLSNGSFAFWTDAGNDAADTMQYITSQSWSNGRVGSTGGSANAIAAYMQPLAEPGPPSALRVAFNIVGQGLLHETAFQGGAYRESLISGWLLANGNEAYIPTVTANEGWSPYWNSTDFAAGPRWDLWNYPAVHAAGFYDIFSTKQIQTVLAINSQGGPQAQGLQYLIVDPGGHCAGGAINWTNATWGWGLAESFSLQLFAETLDFNLSAVPAETLRRWSPVDMDVAKRLMQTTTTVWYVLGPGEIFSTGNYWVGGDGFPTPTYVPYYLITTGRQLSLGAPTDTNTGNDFAVFPGAPLATIGGNNLILTPCGPQDQSSLEKEHALEMVVFTSAVLNQNVAITGIITAHLFVSSTANDTDIVCKLEDVFPTGESMLVQDGILRMRWRNGPLSTTPTLMVPNQIYEVDVEIGFMSYIFNPLHQIRLTVQGTNYPRFSANNQNGGSESNPGQPVDGVTTVYADAAHPSSLVLPIVPVPTLEAMRL